MHVARPLLPHERAVLGEFPAVVHCANPRVMVTQPGTRLEPRTREMRGAVTSSVFRLDMAFGPEDDNDTVYSNTVNGLLDTALKVSKSESHLLCERSKTITGWGGNIVRLWADWIRQDSYRDGDH